jgi:hypothetical protein
MSPSLRNVLSKHRWSVCLSVCLSLPPSFSLDCDSMSRLIAVNMMVEIEHLTLYHVTIFAKMSYEYIILYPCILQNYIYFVSISWNATHFYMTHATYNILVILTCAIYCILLQ